MKLIPYRNLTDKKNEKQTEAEVVPSSRLVEAEVEVEVEVGVEVESYS